MIVSVDNGKYTFVTGPSGRRYAALKITWKNIEQEIEQEQNEH